MKCRSRCPAGAGLAHWHAVEYSGTYLATQQRRCSHVGVPPIRLGPALRRAGLIFWRELGGAWIGRSPARSPLRIRCSINSPPREGRQTKRPSPGVKQRSSWRQLHHYPCFNYSKRNDGRQDVRSGPRLIRTYRLVTPWSNSTNRRSDEDNPNCPTAQLRHTVGVRRCQSSLILRWSVRC